MLNRVTITGADDNTSIQEMSELSSEFPFLEWGILVSRSRVGTPRYPSFSWCDMLASSQLCGNIAMHVCGVWARGAFNGSLHWSELPLVRVVASRYQINGKGDHSDTNFRNFTGWSDSVEFIFQHPASQFLIARLNSEVSRGGDGLKASALFDRSGGKGISPYSWPSPISRTYCGYAGGLDPDNVTEELDKIQRIQPDFETQFWIDMEGRMRDDQDRLDMDKARRVAELCAPFVRQDNS